MFLRAGAVAINIDDDRSTASPCWVARQVIDPVFIEAIFNEMARIVNFLIFTNLISNCTRTIYLSSF